MAIDEKAKEVARAWWNSQANPSLDNFIEAYESARTTPEPSIQARTLEEMPPEGKRTKAEEWEACYAALFNMITPIMDENKKLKQMGPPEPRASDKESIALKALQNIIAYETHHGDEKYMAIKWLKKIARNAIVAMESVQNTPDVVRPADSASDASGEGYYYNEGDSSNRKDEDAVANCIVKSPASDLLSEPLKKQIVNGLNSAFDSIGSPTRYTDGTVSREYEDQPSEIWDDKTYEALRLLVGRWSAINRVDLTMDAGLDLIERLSPYLRSTEPVELAKLRAVNSHVIERLKMRMSNTKSESEAAWLDSLIDQLEGATESTSVLNTTERESDSAAVTRGDDQPVGKSGLKPCPFCGGRAQYFSRLPEIGNVSQKGNIWWVACGDACEQSVEAGHVDKEDSAKAWNARTTIRKSGIVDLLKAIQKWSFEIAEEIPDHIYKKILTHIEGQ